MVEVAATEPMMTGKDPAIPPMTVFWAVFGLSKTVQTTL